MNRLVKEKLIAWKNSANRKPLLIYGARQIGKTYAVLDFGKKEYDNVLYCNFESDKELSSIFDRTLNPVKIIESLEAYYSVSVVKARTLIFFDEIQSCEAALTSLKYFNEEANEYHIIAAGSLLGLAVNRRSFSFPVGKVNMLNMFPMNFEEFLIATGNEKVRDMIVQSYNSLSPMPLHEKALDLYRSYLVVGGFPRAVKVYVETHDLNLVRSEQAAISEAYIADMSKYAAPSETVKSIEIYNSIFSQLGKETTKFQYSVVSRKARTKTYEVALSWLKASNVIINCPLTTQGNYPLTATEDLKTFKIYYCDVGLLTLKGALSPNKVIQNIGISDKVRGMLAESYVAEQLIFNGFNLHYWDSNNTSEVDFVIHLNGEAIPIEVKSADNVRAKSLKTYVSKYSPKFSIRISSRNFGFENNVKSIPLYAAFCIKDDDIRLA